MTLYAYKFPELGEGIHEGEIVKLLIKPGDDVTDESILMEVQNDKAVVEVPCPVEGKIIDIQVKEGQVCSVGQLVAHIEIAGAGAQPSVSDAVPATAHAIEHHTSISTLSVDSSAEASQGNNKVLQVNATKTSLPAAVLPTPSVRKLAREQGVPLTQIPPTGKHGHVTREDVMHFARQQPGTWNVTVQEDSWLANEKPMKEAANEQSVQHASPKERVTTTNREHTEERIPFKGIRKVIANAMTKSMYTAPHVTLMDEVEVSALIQLREKAKPHAEKKAVKLTYLPFIVKALTAACRQYPILNAMLDEEKQEIVYKHNVHVGIATDTAQGLLVPVITDADQLTIWSLAHAIQDLSKRARENKSTPSELRGSTITITNIGSVGGMFFTPIINYPEVAILGVGRMTEKPIVKEGQIVIGSMMALSLSFDHRIVDGATAQAFLNVVKSYLADPALLILEV